MTPRTRRGAALALVLCGALALTGCSDDATKDDAEAAPKTTSAVDVPAGVTLTEPGSTVPLGKPATVGYPVGEAASVITVTVASVTQGSIADLGAYVLDKVSATSTPYYVQVQIRNDGPDALGAAAVPVYGFDTTPAYFPPTTFSGGRFERCPGGTLPRSFEAGATWKGCFVLLVPQGRRLQSVQVRTTELAQPVSWPVS